MEKDYKSYLLSLRASLNKELLEDIVKVFYLSDSNKMFSKDKVRILRGLKRQYNYFLKENWFYNYSYLMKYRNLKKKQIKDLDRLINIFQYLQKCELTKQ